MAKFDNRFDDAADWSREVQERHRQDETNIPADND